MAKRSGELNSKNLPFDQKGSGLAYAGITEDNLFARFQKLYTHRGEKEGGSKQAWDAIVKNTNKSIARSRSPVALEFQKFLNTGKLPANPSDQFKRFAAESLDYGVRENTRAQQHKKSFLNSTFGKILGTVAQVGAGFIPGVGPAIAATLGGALGYMNGGGPLGAFTGALQGYAGGKFGANVGNAVSTTGGWGSAFANPGAFAHNLWNGSNFFGRTLDGVNNIPGALGSGAGFAHIGNSAANGGGMVSNLINGGKDVFSQFTRTLDGVKNGINSATGGLSGAVGDAAQGVSKVRDAVGTLTGGGTGMAGSSSGGSPGIFETYFGSKGSNKASDTLYKQLMALYGDVKGKPFDIRNPYGAGVDMSEGYAKPVLNDGLKRTFSDFDALINKTGSAARNLDQRGLANEFFDQIDTLASRRDSNMFNSLESKLFNKSGVNTGTANNVADFRNQLEEGRQKRVFDATTAAQGYTSNMFKNFLALTQGRTDLSTSIFEPLKIASDISNQQQQGRANAANYAAAGFYDQARSNVTEKQNDGSMIDDALDFFSMFGT